MSITIKKVYNNISNPAFGEILCFHRVTPTKSYFVRNRELEVTPLYFEKLILEYSEKNYIFVPIDRILSQKGLLPKRYINISFDDGFSDIYEYAFPILKKYKIPFTLYVATDFPEGKADMWWLKLEKYILYNNTITDRSGRTWTIKKAQEKASAFEEIMRLVFDSSLPPNLALQEFCEDSFFSINISEKDKALTWEQINEMVMSGLCTIGSHSCSHTILTKISHYDMQKELIASKQLLEKRCNTIVNHFSYPYSYMNEELIGSVIKSGYKSAVIGYGGRIRKNSSRYELFRQNITDLNDLSQKLQE